jgi:hypothetical protein
MVYREWMREPSGLDGQRGQTVRCQLVVVHAVTAGIELGDVVPLLEAVFTRVPGAGLVAVSPACDLGSPSVWYRRPGLPVLLASLPVAEIGPDSPVTRPQKAAPRPRSGRPCAEQLRRAASAGGRSCLRRSGRPSPTLHGESAREANAG